MELLKAGYDLVEVLSGFRSGGLRDTHRLFGILIGSGQKIYFIATEPPIACEYVGERRTVCVPHVQVRVRVEKGGRDIEMVGHGKMADERPLRLRSGFAPFDIIEIFDEQCRNRHRQKETEKAGDFGADKKRKNDKHRRNTDNLLHNERVDKVILELLDDEIKTRDEERKGHPASRIG